MEIKRIVFKPRLKKFFNLRGICYLNLNGSIYFLENTKIKSIDYLRTLTDFENKTPLEFYKIINQDFLKKNKATKKAGEIKKTYYAEMRIKRKKLKIQRLKAEIKQEELNLKGMSTDRRGK